MSYTTKLKFNIETLINASWFCPPNNETIETEVRMNDLYQCELVLPS